MLKENNYKSMLQKCQADYEQMYKMMDSKLKFYSENEKSLLESVKTTIYTTYEKTENLKQEHYYKVKELEDKINKLENELTMKNNNTQRIQEGINNQIKNLNDELNLKNLQLSEITTNYKVLKEDMKNNGIIITELKEQITNYKQLLNNKDNYYKEQIDKCSSKLIISTSEKKNISISEKDEINRIKEQISVSENNINKVFDDQILRGQKILDNLELIEKKLFSVADKHKFNNTDHYDKFHNSTFRFSQVNTQVKTKEHLIKKLDFILFEDINHSRKLYQMIENMLDQINDLKIDKEICESENKKLLEDSLEMKEALAELEIKFRLLKNNTK